MSDCDQHYRLLRFSAQLIVYASIVLGITVSGYPRSVVLIDMVAHDRLSSAVRGLSSAPTPSASASTTAKRQRSLSVLVKRAGP